MIKYLFLFIFVTTLVSCSNDDISATQEKVLEKVVFYRNSPNEKQWNFNNNLLTTITLTNGTIVEEFTYDNLNRLIRDTKYSGGIITEVDNISYNPDNTINAINDLPYTFNATTRTYTYSYGSSFTINCRVNSDLLALDYTRTGFDAKEFHMTYSNGNMTSFEKVATGTSEILKNFNFDTILMDNPIAEAVIAVARVKSLTDPNFFVDAQASQKVPVGFDKGSSDPYYYNYGAIPEDKLYQVGIEVLDSNNNFVDFYSFADYYYQ